MKRTVILASASPRRRELLNQIQLDFKVIPSEFEEDMSLEMPPHKLVEHLAAGKAAQVADQHPEAIVIGSDTIVVLEGEILGKPADTEDARRKLNMLSNKQHSVYTGYAVMCKASNKEIIGYSESAVTFRRIAATEVDEYVGTGEPLDKAGAYGIQGVGAKFIQRIEGDYSGIVGLPLNPVWQAIQAMQSA